MPDKILVVEDSRPQALAAKLILSKHGYEVEVAEDGQAGLEKIAENEFDLIVTDINMPRMDGYQMCEQLKDDPATCDIPIVITTTRNSAEDIIRGLEVGAINFITKPFQPNDLSDRVKRVLEAARNGGTEQDKSLHQLKNMMQDTSEKTQIFEVLFEAFGKVLECQLMGILLTDQGAGDLLFIMSQYDVPENAAIDFSDILADEYNRQNPHENPIMETDCRKFVIVQNPEEESFESSLRFRSTLTAPLVCKGIVIGQIGIGHSNEKFYSMDDTKMLCALAMQAAESLRGLEI